MEVFVWRFCDVKRKKKGSDIIKIELTNNELMTIELSLMHEIRKNDSIINETTGKLKETLLKQNNEMKVIINKLNEMMLLNIKKECI